LGCETCTSRWDESKGVGGSREHGSSVRDEEPVSVTKAKDTDEAHANDPDADALNDLDRALLNAVQWDFPDRASEVNGIVVRPKYFPAGGTFVIEAFTLPGRHDYSPTLSFMVVGKVPTCVVPMVGSGPGVGVPTR